MAQIERTVRMKRILARGKHDRPWPERPIFGKVRYMNSDGLKRKSDADKYVEKIRSLSNI
jgi:deoxyribodipyrimidine photo-lyase